MKTQCSSIKANDNVKLLLKSSRKIQNTADIGILALTKATISRRELDISSKKKILKWGMSCTISSHKTDGYLYKKAYNWQKCKKNQAVNGWKRQVRIKDRY